MATLAVPPYDVILWMVVFALGSIIAVSVACCCCNTPPPGMKRPGALYQVLRVVRILVVALIKLDPPGLHNLP